MTSNERALRAMRAQLQFELAQIGAEVSEASTFSASAQRQVTALTQLCEAAARELRGAMERSPINPALLDATRHLYLAEQHALNESRTRLAAAQQREERARAELADVRNRERSLERALQAERRRQQQKQQALDMICADDMWLQHAWRELS